MTNCGAVSLGEDHGQAVQTITRRRFLGIGAAGSAAVLMGIAFPAVVTPARGEERTIKVGMYSNPRTPLIKSTVIKRLEEKHRVKVLIDEGLTTEQLDACARVGTIPCTL